MPKFNSAFSFYYNFNLYRLIIFWVFWLYFDQIREKVKKILKMETISVVKIRSAERCKDILNRNREIRRDRKKVKKSWLAGSCRAVAVTWKQNQPFCVFCSSRICSKCIEHFYFKSPSDCEAVKNKTMRYISKANLFSK